MSGQVRTDNVEMAATLMHNGIELVDVIREDPDSPTVTFVFPSSDEANAVVTAFMTGASRVDPRAYSANVRKLMGLIRRGQA